MRRCFLLLAVFHLFSCFASVGREEVRLRSETMLCCELPRNFQPRQFANDASGATYVTGYTFIPADDDHYESWDILTLKFDSAGHGVWTNRYDGFNLFDDAGGLVLDGSGNVLVVGASQYFQDGPSAMVTLKYAPNGLPLWTNLYYGRYFPFLGVAGSYGRAVAVDRLGNVTVAGFPYFAGPDESDIVKYDADGIGVWTNHASASRILEFLAADSNGDVTFVGASVTNGGLIAKYSAAGVPLWTNNVFGWLPAGLTLDSEANAVALFWAGEDFTLTKYTPKGVPIWTNRFPRPNAVDFTWPLAITADARDSIYVAVLSGANVITTKFGADGGVNWTSSAKGTYGLDTSLRFVSASPREVVLAQDIGAPDGLIYRLLFEYFQPPRNNKADR